MVEPFFQLTASSNILTGYKLIGEQIGRPLEVLRMVEFKIPNVESLQENEVLVELLASHINHADLLNLRGFYATKPSVPINAGFEGVFKVIGIGKQVKSFGVGDIVMPNAIDCGTWSTHLTLCEKNIVKLPKDIDILSAAMLQINGFTAYLSLKHMTPLKLGDIVVQNGATGHVGQNTIQFAREMGLRTINFIRQSADSPTAEILYKMGADAIISIKEDEKVDKKKLLDILKQYDWFDPERVALGLNCIGGAFNQAVDILLRDRSTHVTFGGMNTPFIRIANSSMMGREIKYMGLWVTKWKSANMTDKKYTDMVEYICKFYKSGNYYRPPVHCFPLTEYKEAIGSVFHKSNEEYLPKRFFLTLNKSFHQNVATLCRKLPK